MFVEITNGYFFTVCRNCHVQCTSNLCIVCLLKPECRRCRRRLPNNLFARGSDVCETCVRKTQKGPSRSALDGAVTEYDLETSDSDVDLRSFLMNNNGELVNILQRALDTNM